jgi:nanoRNase/pAp phosphatase (c-di-AMP/oligoRNAs hydrolase)
MASAGSTNRRRSRQICVIGDNRQVIETIRMFAGSDYTVHVITAAPEIEGNLIAAANVNASLIENYETLPEDIPSGPYFICVDQTAVAQAIREKLPATRAIFHLGTERTARQYRRSKQGLLQLHEPLAETRRRLLNRLDTIHKVDRLCSMVKRGSSPLILIYGDPDPDAIGAAMGLATIWQAVGAQPIIRYTGNVSRYQNQLLLSYLKEEIAVLGKNEQEEAEFIAVVDAQPAFWKENKPAARVIIDHHPECPCTNEAEFVDLQTVGSTCTMLTDYLSSIDFPINKQLATALHFGLSTDTNDLTRNATPEDIAAAAFLHSRSDHNFLGRLYRAKIPAAALDHIAWAISNRYAYRDLLIVHNGTIDTPDYLVQIADFLLYTCGVTWVVAAGVYKEKLVVVLRGDGHRLDVGARAKQAFDKIGSAGGHRIMGRAEIPLTSEDPIRDSVTILVENLFKRLQPTTQDQMLLHMRRALGL